ncbi:hypothetical protein G9A89_004539 [Geosiphon pyriformis]|nr:hypothetical protein G9A89_004539 [Geosiphon pyriformis]
MPDSNDSAYLGISKETTITESDFCNYINAKINCLLDHAIDTKRLGEQIHQSLLRYLTTTTTQAITETLCIVDTDIKHYVTKQFPQVQQPIESDLKEYEYGSNNSTTVQDKSTVNKKPRILFLTTPSYHQTLQSRIVFNPPLETHWNKSLEEYGSLFGNLTPAVSQPEGNTSTWEQPSAQNPIESASPLIEGTAILQPIGSSDKEKQSALAPGKHSNMWTPIPLNITSNTPPINQIMAYWNIAKLEKFSSKEDNAYSWIYQSLAEKPIFFTEFKLTFLQYIYNFNTLIRLQNQFIILIRDFELAKQKPEAQKLINHHNREKITTIADTHSNRTVSNSNNLGDPIPTTKEDNRPKSGEPIPATQISAKHGTPIFHISESTAPIHTTSSVHSTTTPELLSTTTNDTNNSSLSNFPLHGLFRPIPCGSVQSRPTPTGYPNQAFYFSLMEDQGFNKSISVKGGDVEQIFQPSKQAKNNIPPTTITKDTTLAAIFLFDINNLNTHSLFNGAAINQNKPIIVLYTDARVGGIDIKLILDNRLADSIITKQLIDQLCHQVDHINKIQIPTKVLVIEATQYQALYVRVLAMCRHFKTQHTKKSFIEFEDTLLPPTIETYQVL